MESASAASAVSQARAMSDVVLHPQAAVSQLRLRAQSSQYKSDAFITRIPFICIQE